MADLPFLPKKNKNMGAGVAVVTREPDDGAAILDMVLDELLDAIAKKDKSLLLDAVRAIVLHVLEEEESQDEGAR